MNAQRTGLLLVLAFGSFLVTERAYADLPSEPTPAVVDSCPAPGCPAVPLYVASLQGPLAPAPRAQAPRGVNVLLVGICLLVTGMGVAFVPEAVAASNSLSSDWSHPSADRVPNGVLLGFGIAGGTLFAAGVSMTVVGAAMVSQSPSSGEPAQASGLSHRAPAGWVWRF